MTIKTPLKCKLTITHTTWGRMPGPKISVEGEQKIKCWVFLDTSKMKSSIIKKLFAIRVESQINDVNSRLTIKTIFHFIR